MNFSYVIYIAGGAERVWDALTDSRVTAEYWGHSNVSDWREGSGWAHVRTDGSGIADVAGSVVHSERPTRLVTTWVEPGGEERETRVTFRLREYEGIVRLTVTHEGLPGEKELGEVALGWPAVLSNLKTLLETGRPLPWEPWTVPAD